MLRASFLYLSHRRGLQRFVTRQRLTASLAYRFVAGDRLEDAARVVMDINRRGATASLDHLGENVTEEKAARAATDDYLAAFERIAGGRLNGNVSVKLTQLGLDISPDLCRELLTRVLQRAQQLDNFVRIDMEGSAYTQRTLDLVLELHQQYPNCGVVLQSYLYRTLDDVARMNAAQVRVRLVKGAYDEPPPVAFPKKADVDANFRAAMEQLLLKGTYPAIATHDDRLIDATKGFAREHGIGPDRYEFQMLYGIRRDLQDRLLREGYRVRIYVPYGTEWYPYLMRRLAERPANLLFLVRSVIRERRAA
ncbi:MAG TPA: proline dehydrogenase family protein [Candidatus Dormibacteraeota bacterium]|jgi:proline dehydrogenase|nr:proline dehydrogenase family protein [Candidatus Dormibacteraeota bacterium]